MKNLFSDRSQHQHLSPSTSTIVASRSAKSTTPNNVHPNNYHHTNEHSNSSSNDSLSRRCLMSSHKVCYILSNENAKMINFLSPFPRNFDQRNNHRHRH